MLGSGLAAATVKAVTYLEYHDKRVKGNLMETYKTSREMGTLETQISWLHLEFYSHEMSSFLLLIYCLCVY